MNVEAVAKARFPIPVVERTETLEVGAVDAFFRQDAASAAAISAPAADQTATASEVTGILANGLALGSLVPVDAKYMAQLIASAVAWRPQPDHCF